MRLGERIRALREERHLSQQALAEAAQMDDKHLGVAERGGTNLTVSSLFGIARALDVPLAALFDGV
ncbi:MAG: helix-turn-helix transcriptional regulator [Myxococcales bacterium]